MENEKKHYQTAGRTALLTYLKKYTSEAPQAAHEIYRGLGDGESTPGRSSVYRMLGDLAQEGLVRRFRASAEGEGYVYQFVGAGGNCEGHLHLQCLACGKIAHLKCACNAEITANLMKTHGFLVDSGRSVLYGTCASCAASEGGNGNA